eukprot:8261225-Alexandrium_andersonii.AAC.1
MAVVAMKILPMALYGSPSSPVASRECEALASRIVDIADEGAAGMRSRHLAFLHMHSRDLDPWVNVAVLRCAAFRRAWAKEPTLR